jgi:hypothetical protein
VLAAMLSVGVFRSVMAIFFRPGRAVHRLLGTNNQHPTSNN